MMRSRGGAKVDRGQKQIERVRRICLNLPETTEKLSHGEPTFFVKKKVFAAVSNNHHNDGHLAVVLPAAIGIQEMLVSRDPKKYYRPPYVGVRGWVGVELELVDDEELTFHLLEAWKHIAPPRLQVLLSPTSELSRRGKKTKLAPNNHH
jgi:hypothetical protein